MSVRRRLAALAATAALVTLLPVTAAADAAKRPAHRTGACHDRAASALRFSRTLGRTVGTLRWRAPVALRHQRGLRYRILHDGRIVGQTTRRSVRIRVTLGRVHRFAVVPLGAVGRPSRCVVSKRVRVAYRAPGTPRDLAVAGDETGMRLTWRKGRRGDGRLAGYRLLRNGTTIGQTRHTSWRLGAGANRAYRFVVVAVDRRGHASRRSRAVTLATGHAPPTAPSGVQATVISDTAIGVQWQPSPLRSGRIAGYRVLRDGRTVTQARGTSLVLDHLAPSTSYRLSVVAIDNLGYLSPPSVVVEARTQVAVPSSGHVHAFLLASTGASFHDFQARYQQIGVLYPTYFDCTGAAALAGRDDPLVTRWAQARSVRVLPRINCQRSAVVHRILTDGTTRAQWLDRLVALAQDNGYDGISLDFEAGPPTDRAALTAFVDDLAARLHAAGKLLTIAVSAKTRDIPGHPRSGIFDYDGLSQAADWVFVMAWGLHWATSAPGAQDDATWVAQVLGYVTTMPLKHKFVYGTNLYAMDWPAGGGPGNKGTAYEYDDFIARLPTLGASVQLDATTDALHATYVAGGVSHDVWYPDASTIGRRLRSAVQLGLGGVGFWRLGREHQQLWQDPLLAPGATW